MAVDTRSKRASSVGILIPSTLAPVLPDGTIAQADRQHVAFSYSGILATGAVVVTVAGYTVTLRVADVPPTLGVNDSPATLRLDDSPVKLKVREE